MEAKTSEICEAAATIHAQRLRNLPLFTSVHTVKRYVSRKKRNSYAIQTVSARVTLFEAKCKCKNVLVARQMAMSTIGSQWKAYVHVTSKLQEQSIFKIYVLVDKSSIT